METLLRTENLTKKIKNQVAVQNISMNVPENSVYGLLGPNGAGKSTTLKMIAGILKPTRGSIIFNKHPWKRSDLSNIGALIETPPLYGNLTARENLKVRTELLNISDGRIDEVLEISGLGYDYDVVTKSLSVNEEGAETVRYIFDRYVAGAGSTMIARELNEQGIPTIKGNSWTSSSVMGIINNEKYKGDILLGKTFTVDPISKRRLENLGEEDRFYIKNHHEAIISEETFARAQEIRERRNGGRKKGVAPGKREKFSRQYAFSCMLECGFCGANLSRRRWHSSSKYTKTIWQCVESTKHGKRFCPDSKGIPEQVIEDAFIESYRMLCMDHKDVLEEFIKRVEKTLLEDSIEDKIEKLNRSVYNIQYKRKKLLENYLEGVVAKDIYEETDMGYEKKLSEAKSQLSMLEQQYDNEGSLQRRLAEFKKVLSKNQVLEEFDRGIFESTIEKVIVGGYDENGEKDPYKIIFIL